MQFPAASLLIFAKAPIAGQAKTRLIPQLGADGAAQLQQQLLHECLVMATSKALCAVELWCAPSSDHRYFQQCAEEFPLTLHQQTGDDLGARMSYALRTALKHSNHALLIGTDCPTLNAAHLVEAIGALQDGHDAVLGPAADGGYVMIGLNRHNEHLFNNIAWGTPAVLETTRQRLQSLGWQWHELETLHDLDRAEDLVRYQDRMRKSGATAYRIR